MLLRVALCYSVLQCVAEVAAFSATLRQNNALGADVLCASLRRIICCSVLQCAIALLWRVAVVLLCVAVRNSAGVACCSMCCCVLQCAIALLRRVAVCVVVCCSAQ